MLYLDLKYVNFLSTQLDRFAKKSEYIWNCRCPFCGDSQASKYKARGYIYKKKDALFYKCHNCGFGTTLRNLLKFVDQNLYDQYSMENYSLHHTENAILKPKEQPKEPEKKKFKELDLPTITSLKKTHYAFEYVSSRKIPKEFYSYLYLCEDFETWACKITDGSYGEKYRGNDEPRLIIPFYDRFGGLIAIQGRALIPSKLRYITIKLQEDAEKLFGLERWNKNKPAYLLEGPIDSLFLPNALAMAGSVAAVIDSIVEDKTKMTVVMDNERSNREIVFRMLQFADKGYNVCVWPTSTKEKDINDLILSGLTQAEVKSIIDKNTFNGLSAILNINGWKRIGSR